MASSGPGIGSEPAGGGPGNFHVLLSHAATLELLESRKKAGKNGRKGAAAGARERCLVATRRRARKDMFPLPRVDRARFAAKPAVAKVAVLTRRCSTRSTHPRGKRRGPRLSHAAVRTPNERLLIQRAFCGLTSTKGRQSPDTRERETPPTHTPDRFRALKLGAGPGPFCRERRAVRTFQFFFPYV